jgi:hypothetical protein
MKDTESLSLDLDFRTGWPDALRLFLDRFPRESWEGHVNLGEMSRFWLEIHAQFREVGQMLKAGTLDFREGRMSASDYRRWFKPRLSYFLTGLQHHHQIEDHQFFPLFGAAEPRLITGFEVLESDHENIHAAMNAVVASANEFLALPDSDRDAMMKSADRYADTGEALLKKLLHHLDDEEDLIIPLILDRGERVLGIGS